MTRVAILTLVNDCSREAAEAAIEEIMERVKGANMVLYTGAFHDFVSRHMLISYAFVCACRCS